MNIDKPNLVIAGCSYLGHTSGPLPEKHNDPFYGICYPLRKSFNVTDISVSGNSNDGIIRSIYHYIKEYNPKNTTFLFQVTYLHRVGGYFNNFKDWINVQPQMLIENYKHGGKNKENDIFEIKNSLKPLLTSEWKNIFNNLSEIGWHEATPIRNYYESFISSKYDESIEFNELMFKLDLLKSFVNQSDNHIKFMWWPTTLDTMIPMLSKFNFFKIDGEYSILDWSLKNKEYVSFQDTHLTAKGHDVLAKILLDTYL